MGASKAQRAAAADKRARAIAMRLAGVDWQTVADTVGYRSPGAAYNAVAEALKNNRRTQGEDTEELRQVTVMRYDRLQAAFWPKALKGDPKAGEIVLKCLAGRAKIEGVEAPTRVNVQAEQLGAEILDLLGQVAGQPDEQGDDQPSI